MNKNPDPNRDLAEQRINMGKDPGGYYSDLNIKYRNQQQQSSSDYSCFTWDTKLLTDNGWKNISSLNAGDLLISFSAKNGALHQREVLKLKIHKRPSQIWRIATEGDAQSVKTTKYHSFFTRRGWVVTQRLNIGDFITVVDHEGNVLDQKVISIFPTGEYEVTYNLVTSGENNFIAEGYIAHNFTYFRSIRSLIANILHRAIRGSKVANLPLLTFGYHCRP